MMNFVYENLSIVLRILVILVVVLKILAWVHIDRLKIESPNPGPARKNVNCFLSYELVSAILSAFFFFLVLDLFWVWEILIGTFVIWVVEINLARLYFWITDSLVNLFFSTSVWKKYKEKQMEEFVRDYNKFLEETLKEKEKAERLEGPESLKNK